MCLVFLCSAEVFYNIIGFFNPVTLNKTFFDVRKLSPIGSCPCEEPSIRAVAQYLSFDL